MPNTTSFILNEFTGSDAQVRVTLTEEEPDVVQVSLEVVSGYLADTVGFFANFNGLTVNNNFTITPVASNPGPALIVGTQPGTGLLYLDASGSTIDGKGDLDSNVNLNGQGVKRDYHLGVQIGDGGLGKGDDYQAVTFNLSSPGLTVNNFSQIGMRLQSVLENGKRDGSSKLEGIPDNGTDTPLVAISKVTNGADGQTILAGEDITWTYVVTNTGNVTLTNLEVTDDNGTIEDTTDDFVVGTIAELAAGASASLDFFGGQAIVGAYSNIGTVTTTYNGTPVTDEDPSDYFGADPGIAIDKVTDNGSVQGDGLLIQQGSAIEWVYTVTNTGNVGLSNVVVSDNDPLVTPIAVDQDGNGVIDGDLNGDGILDMGETWVYKATGTAINGAYENTGTVTASFTDDLGNLAEPSASDDSSYNGVPIAGARTPGFWKNWKQAWDGNATNDSRFVGRENFAGGDVLLAPYTAATTDPVTGQKTTGLLIGDYNRNGVTDAGENTIFYTLAEAHKLVDASKKDDQDSRFILGRSMVATWLNFLAVNPTPISELNDGIRWMQSYTADETGDETGDGNVFNGGAIHSKSDAWSGDIAGIRNGSEINAALDYYNNTGNFGTQLIV